MADVALPSAAGPATFSARRGGAVQPAGPATAPTHHKNRTPDGTTAHVGLVGWETAWASVPDLVTLSFSDVTFDTAPMRCRRPQPGRKVITAHVLEAVSWMT